MQKSIVIEVAVTVFLSMLLVMLIVFPKARPAVEFDQYIWQNFAPDSNIAYQDIGRLDNSPYEPLALKISENIWQQTGISLEAVVAQGGKVIFNFFYSDASPIITGHCELVEVIILSKDDKVIQDYFLEYTSDKLVLQLNSAKIRPSDRWGFPVLKIRLLSVYIL